MFEKFVNHSTAVNFLLFKEKMQQRASNFCKELVW